MEPERYGTCSDASGYWGIEDDGKVILSGLVSHDACDAVMDILDERDALKAEVERLNATLQQAYVDFEKRIRKEAAHPTCIKLNRLVGDKNNEIHRLKAEVERLKVEADWKTPARRNKALEAEVERLQTVINEARDYLGNCTILETPGKNAYALVWLNSKNPKP